MPKPFLQTICRYPVKAFPGQILQQTSVKVWEGIPHDRCYALTNGSVDTGKWMHSRDLFSNANDDGIQNYALGFDENPDRFNLTNPNGETVFLVPGDSEQLASTNNNLDAFLSHLEFDENMPKPQFIERDSASALWDYEDTTISFINPASVHQISQVLNQPLDISRFRGNLILGGLDPWEEHQYLGKRIAVGEAEFAINSPIRRCPAPGVDPATGKRDIDFEKEMPEHLGHVYCGLYAQVVKSGRIETNDRIEIIGDIPAPGTPGGPTPDRLFAAWPRSAKISVCDVGEQRTYYQVELQDAWTFDNAVPGQRIRLHLGSDGWASQFITDASFDRFAFEVGDSNSDDPITLQMRKGLNIGREILVSGPYGRA